MYAPVSFAKLGDAMLEGFKHCPTTWKAAEKRLVSTFRTEKLPLIKLEKLAPIGSFGVPDPISLGTFNGNDEVFHPRYFSLWEISDLYICRCKRAVSVTSVKDDGLMAHQPCGALSDD